MIFTMIYPFAETLLVCLKDMHKSKAILVKGNNLYFLGTLTGSRQNELYGPPPARNSYYDIMKCSLPKSFIAFN